MTLRLLSLWTILLVVAGPGALAKSPAPGAVRIQVRNALVNISDDVRLSVPRLDGWFVPKPGGIVSLDKKPSFVLQIVDGETHLTAEDLTALANEYLLPHAKTPIRNLTIRFDGGMVEVKGDLHKGVDLPFEGKGAISLAANGAIRIHFTELKVAGMVKKGLLDFLGIKLAQVAQPERVSRFYMEGDDVLLPITALFPPPRISGQLTAVRIEGDELIQVFGPANAAVPPPPTPAPNYMYFSGGRMKFGKLTMDNVDLELVDADPSNSFNFSLDHYYEQLEAGCSKSLPSLGLLAVIPDYATVAKSARPEAKK